MSNKIPTKTLLKGLELIQGVGVEEESIFEVSKFFDPNIGEKILQDYIQKGVVGDLDLSGNLNIQKLPEGLKVQILNLTGNKTLKDLPKIEAEIIYAENTNIQTIGEGLKCRWLDLEDNKTLKHLPKIEAGTIWAPDTNIQTIGDGLECNELNLRGNKMLKEFPQNLNINVLFLYDTYFSKTYTEARIRELIEDAGGEVRMIKI